MNKYVERLARALEKTDMFQAVRKQENETQITIIGRVANGAEAKWTQLMEEILLAEQGEAHQPHAWATHICKRFILKDDKIVFGWNIAVQSQDLGSALDFIEVVVTDGYRPQQGSIVEIDSIPLSGLEGVKDRNVPRPGSKKGAYLSGSGSKP